MRPILGGVARSRRTGSEHPADACSMPGSVWDSSRTCRNQQAYHRDARRAPSRPPSHPRGLRVPTYTFHARMVHAPVGHALRIVAQSNGAESCDGARAGRATTGRVFDARPGASNRHDNPARPTVHRVPRRSPPAARNRSVAPPVVFGRFARCDLSRGLAIPLHGTPVPHRPRASVQPRSRSASGQRLTAETGDKALQGDEVDLDAGVRARVGALYVRGHDEAVASRIDAPKREQGGRIERSRPAARPPSPSGSRAPAPPRRRTIAVCMWTQLRTSSPAVDGPASRLVCQRMEGCAVGNFRADARSISPTASTGGGLGWGLYAALGAILLAGLGLLIIRRGAA